MTSVDNRPLKVFLCHSSNDKPAVRELYQKLRAEPWIRPWLDEEELYPGQDWNMEIEKAIEATDAIIVCLSNNSITKEGYVQKEIKTALDYSDYKPEGTVFIIPVRLEDCKPPSRLSKWQYADYFEGQRERGTQRLLVSLKNRADSLGVKYEKPILLKNKKAVVETSAMIEEKTEHNRFEKAYERARKNIAESYERVQKNIGGRKPVEAYSGIQPEHPTVDWIASNKITLSNGMELMRVPAGKFLMGSTKESTSAYSSERPQHTVDIPYDYWMARYPVTNELYNAYAKAKNIKHPVDGWEKKKDHPLTYVKWIDAIAYCKWLNSFLKNELPSVLVLRLPTEAEWEKAARGTDGREYPWGNQFDKNKCNTSEGGKSGTTSVGLYSPQGDSPYGCADMSGNVWEWTHSLMKPYPYKTNDGREDEKASTTRVLRGGSFLNASRLTCGFYRHYFVDLADNVGFRVVASPVLS